MKIKLFSLFDKDDAICKYCLVIVEEFVRIIDSRQVSDEIDESGDQILWHMKSDGVELEY